MPELNWIGKSQVVNHAEEVPFRLLKNSNEDTQYKQALGHDWANLDPENRYFRVVGEADVAETLREVAQL